MVVQDIVNMVKKGNHKGHNDGTKDTKNLSRNKPVNPIGGVRTFVTHYGIDGPEAWLIEPPPPLKK